MYYAKMSRNELLQYHYTCSSTMYSMYTHKNTRTHTHTKRGKQTEKHDVQGERSQEDKEKDTHP